MTATHQQATEQDVRLSPAPDQRRALRRAWSLARPHRWRLAGAGAVAALLAVVRLAGPVLVGVAADAVVDADRRALATACAGFGVATVALYVLERARGVLAARAGEAVLVDLRETVTSTLVHRPLGFFDRHRSGELVARATTDVTGLSGFVRDGLPQLLDSLLLAVVTAVVLIGASPILAAIALVYVPLAVLATRRYRRAAEPAMARYAEAEAQTTAAITDTASARPFLRGLGATAAWADRVARVDRDLLAANDAALRADNRLSILGFHQQLTLAAIVLVGGTLAADGHISIGTVAAVALALRQLFGPLDELSWLYARAQRARANLARILELTEGSSPPCMATQHPGAPPQGPAGLAVHDLTFRYAPDGPPAIDGVTLTVPAGQRLALVGATGSGKSTLAKLMTGLLVPDRGTVRVAGQEVGAWDPVALRRSVVLLPQEGHVMAGTLADNLRLVPGDHTDADLDAAIRRAGLGPWVDSLPHGLDTDLADRGANLSAGERQLVSLARAALADPAVLVLDEATADIDPGTEALVSDALDRLMVGRTVVIVAHRPATAARCHRTVTLASGRIIGDRLNPSPETPAPDPPNPKNEENR